MRKVGAAGLAILGFIASAQAASEVETYAGASAQQSTLILGDGSPAGLKRWNQGLTLTLDPFAHNTSLTAGIEMVEPDYAGVLLERKDGTSYSLKDLNPRQTEFNGRLGFQVYIPNASIGLNASAPLTQSPYASRSLGLQVQREFFEKATILTVAASWSEANAPEDYWTDYDFQIHARPGLTHSHAVTASWEQVVSERLRTKVALFTGQKWEERPRHVGVEAQARYAMKDNLFVGAKLFFLDEDKSAVLQNERGAFTVGSATISVMAEPVYDLSVHLAYSFGLERETDPRRSYALLVGSDQYSLGLSYAARFGTLYSQVNYLAAANATRQWSATGGVKWKL